MTVGIEGVVIRSLERFTDERGAFTELARFARYPGEFRQANHSRSAAGVLRGLHYHQYQADLWYVVRGRAQVAIADLRHPPDASTHVFTMTGDEPAVAYIPPGVAHGFLAVTDLDLIYLVTEEFDASDEHGLAWNDPTLDIRWDTSTPILSERDQANEPLRWNRLPAFS